MNNRPFVFIGGPAHGMRIVTPPGLSAYVMPARDGGVRDAAVYDRRQLANPASGKTRTVWIQDNLSEPEARDLLADLLIGEFVDQDPDENHRAALPPVFIDDTVYSLIPGVHCLLCGEPEQGHNQAACDEKMRNWKPTGLAGLFTNEPGPPFEHTLGPAGDRWLAVEPLDDPPR